MHHKHHHHHIGAISLVPLLLLLIVPQWGKATMAPTIEHYRTLAERAEQEMQVLDFTFANLQRSTSLLKNAEETVSFPSVVRQHNLHSFSSETDRYDLASARNSTLKQRIDVMRKRQEEELGNLRGIYIDLSEQEATLFDENGIRTKYRVSSGAADTPTPRGQFKIHRKQTLRVSSQDVPYRMPNYMAFTESESHGLHALPYLGNGPESSAFWHEARTHIGRPVSHGCVRLLPEDAAALFEWAEVGMPVIIHS
ncbi:MAG TPA: L,D-transpeptidase [Candidatus Peribacterales bacterium]|nr:L,D-transpeptidase [Candidatus Peribacterales bacterium]